MLFPEYPRFFPAIQSSLRPFTSLRSCHIASIAYVPAALASSEIFDLLNDMGIEYTKQAEGAKYARSKISLDAKAAGTYAIDAIWQDLKDVNGLREDCIAGKNLGYSGKSIIHPDQIQVTHE